MQLWLYLVEVTTDKKIKNGAWMHTGFPQANMSTFTKVSFCMPSLSLNAEGQRMRGSCKTICVLSKCPHSIHMRAGQALMEKLPRFQGEAVGFLSRISRHTEAVPGCKSPCGSAPQTGLLAEWVHLNNGPFWLL